MTSMLVETSDRWIPALSELEVNRCCVDYAFTLVLGDSDDRFYVVIEEAFWFTSATGREDLLTPEETPSAMAPALELLRTSVERADAFKDGRLEMDFGGGRRLRVPVSETYEAWSVLGPAGLRLVSLPGGELAVWKPDGGVPPSD